MLVAIALLAACRGESRTPPRVRDDAAVAVAPRDATPSIVPQLPPSDPGDVAMRALDQSIDAAAGNPRRLVPLLLERASITSVLEDYVRALALARDAVAADPASPDLLRLAFAAELRVHRFAEARATLAALDKLVPAGQTDDETLELAQATGDLETALTERARRMELFADAMTVTLYAATLAEAGRADQAIALIPKATEKLRSNTPAYLAWLLFQWGRIYETAGQLATAREFYVEAHRRLPAYVDATEHLAQTLIATGDRAGAAALVDGQPHPALQAIAAELSGDAGKRAATGDAWQRYVDALPLAFSDHAARFWLTTGADPHKALALALVDRVNRDTPRSRALLIEAALASGDPQRACAEVGPLRKAGPRRERFMAWRALSACGKQAEAARLAKDLGIE
jgi:tetratricopeptide (TPR) repeat protein